MAIDRSAPFPASSTEKEVFEDLYTWWEKLGLPRYPWGKRYGISWKTFWISIVALVCLVAVAIGVGIGVGLANKSRSGPATELVTTLKRSDVRNE